MEYGENGKEDIEETDLLEDGKEKKAVEIPRINPFLVDELLEEEKPRKKEPPSPFPVFREKNGVLFTSEEKKEENREKSPLETLPIREGNDGKEKSERVQKDLEKSSVPIFNDGEAKQRNTLKSR
jgi:hypothetical protein